jgi:hypothetical protein
MQASRTFLLGRLLRNVMDHIAYTTSIRSSWKSGRRHKLAASGQTTHRCGRRFRPLDCPREGSCVPAGYDGGLSRSAVTGTQGEERRRGSKGSQFLSHSHHPPSTHAPLPKPPNSAPRMQLVLRQPDQAVPRGCGPIARTATRMHVRNMSGTSTLRLGRASAWLISSAPCALGV